jgi:hypothetical protein
VWSGKARKVAPKDITSLALKVCQEDASDLREPIPQRPRGPPPSGMANEAYAMHSGALSALITLFAQSLNLEIAGYGRLEAHRPCEPPVVLLRLSLCPLLHLLLGEWPVTELASLHRQGASYPTRPSGQS